MTATAAALHTFRCEFGSIGITGDRIRIGFVIPRNRDQDDEIEETLIQRQIQCDLDQSGEDASGQTYFNGVEHDSIKGAVATCNGLGIKRDEFTGSLFFPREAVDVDTMVALQGAKGRIVVYESSEIPDKSGHRDLDGQQSLPFDGTGIEFASQDVSVLVGRCGVTEKMVEKLADKYGTIGELRDAMQTYGTTWNNGVKGIGAEAAAKIADAYQELLPAE